VLEIVSLGDGQDIGEEGEGEGEEEDVSEELEGGEDFSAEIGGEEGCSEGEEDLFEGDEEAWRLRETEEDEDFCCWFRGSFLEEEDVVGFWGEDRDWLDCLLWGKLFEEGGTDLLEAGAKVLISCVSVFSALARFLFGTEYREGARAPESNAASNSLRGTDLETTGFFVASVAVSRRASLGVFPWRAFLNASYSRASTSEGTPSSSGSS